MKNKCLLEDLLDKHAQCTSSEQNGGFIYMEIAAYNTEFEQKLIDHNYLFFVLAGECTVTCNQFANRRVQQGEMFFISISSFVKGSSKIGSKLLCLRFDTPSSDIDCRFLQSLWPLCERVKYDFQILPLRQPLTKMVETLVVCLTNNRLNCVYLHDLKQRELFFYLRHFYKKEEIATLLFPIIGNSIEFKTFIMQNITKTERIENLICLSGMCRSRFFRTFKSVFGITAKQWMQQRLAEQVISRIKEPNSDLNEVIFQLGFGSRTSFYRFCERSFNMNPSELFQKYHSTDQH